jgi:hypothetical protein
MVSSLAQRLTDRRGSLLVVALLILLALSAIGLVVVQKVGLEQSYVGNQRRGTLAYHITEAGAYASLAYADSLGPAGFVTALSTRVEDPATGTGTSTFKSSEFVDSTIDFFDMGKSGSFGFEGYTANGLYNPTLGTPAPMDFRVTITASGMLQPLMGYSLTGPGSRCRFKYQFDTDGNVGTSDTGHDSAEEFNAWKRLRALMFVGPLPCNQTAISGTS